MNNKDEDRSFNPDFAVKFGIEPGIVFSWLFRREREKFLEENDCDDTLYLGLIDKLVLEQSIPEQEIFDYFCFWNKRKIVSLFKKLCNQNVISMEKDSKCNFKIKIIR